jgi:hypothetical protein
MNTVADTDNQCVIGSETALSSIEVVKAGIHNHCDLGTATRSFKDIYLGNDIIAGSVVVDISSAPSVGQVLTAGSSISAGWANSASFAQTLINMNYQGNGLVNNEIELVVPTETNWTDESATWVSDGFNSHLKLPKAGFRASSNGGFAYQGSRYYTWTSTTSGVKARWVLNGGMQTSFRSNGLPIRLIVNGTFTQTQYNNAYLNRSIDYQGFTYGFSFNTTTGIIWLDRNLGASQIATSDSDSSAYGDYYQWGRNPDGHQISTSSTYDGDASGKPALVDESGAWDGKFITTTTDWLGTQNDNLWSGKPTSNKTFTIRTPTASEDFTLFRTDIPITVIEVIAVSTGTSPNTTYQLKHHTDRSNAGNALTTSAATTSITTGDTATLSVVAIPANSWIWLETTAATGTNVVLSIDIRF